MAGLLLNPQIANQQWGTLLLNTAKYLAACNGVNDLINDESRNPPGGAAGLEAMGFTTTDAGLLVPAFASIAALWRHSTNQQAAPMTNFWFQAAQCFGTEPMPT